uniref:Uncharacterized protein n=1 Tax=Noccaea caerulescens TaxID=107243 RepID=A0A1J3G700_NOCCA
MTSTDGVELKSTIETNLPWKMVAKGSRSSTRRNKKSVVRVAASDIEAEDKSSTSTVAGESEPEKLGVSVLGRHFAERVEHVPIKKRRFMVCSPTPSNKSSAQREGSEPRAQINHALPVSRLNPNLIEGRTSDVDNEMPDCSGHDFSGIEILADAACSSVMSNDLAPAVDPLPAEEPLVQQQDASTLSTHVEGNDSSAGTADVSLKDTAVDSIVQAGRSENEIVVSQKSSVETLCNDLADEKSLEHSRVTSGGMIVARKTNIALSDESSTERLKANMEASESENLAPDSGAVTVLEKSSADELTEKEKKNEDLKDVRFHWDLNVTMDAWGQPCEVEDEASGRNVEGEITESIAPKESELIDGRKGHMDGVIASDRHTNFSSPSGSKAEAAARNGKECQSGYDSQFEDGELREPYPWEENEGDTGDVEQLDYGSEPEDERFYSMVDSNDNKMEDSEKGVLAETKFGTLKCESGDALRIGEANEGSDIEKHVVVCMNDSHLKKGSSSPSRSFDSRPFKELPSHDAIQRRRPDNYEEGPDKFVGRDDRSGMHMRNRSPGRPYFSRWDSKRRFSPPNYKGGSYGFGRPRPKGIVDDRGMLNGFDQSGSGPGPGPGPGPDGHVRRQFSNGGYRGRFRRFQDGGDRDFRGPHGDNNQFPGRMHNRMSGNRRERGSSPVFRRLHYPQSESRSGSRSPVSWNGRNNRSSPPPGGFRADERMMERVRLPFQKRFPADQEMGFMSPPRNRMSSPRFFEGRNNNSDSGENHNSFRERKFRPGQRFDAGNSTRRFNSDNNSYNNNNHFRPFIRNRRFESAEDNTGGNRFEMAQQRNRRSEATEDGGGGGGGDDIRRFRLNGEQSVVVANNNDNNNKES